MTLFATLISAIVSWSDRVKSGPVSGDGRLSRSMSGAADKVAPGGSGRTSLFGSAGIHLCPRQPFGRRSKIVPLRLPVAPDCLRFDLDRRGTCWTNVESSPRPDRLERKSSQTVSLPNVQKSCVVHSSVDGTRSQTAIDEQGKFSTGDRRDSSDLSSGENGFGPAIGANIGLRYRSSFDVSAVGNSNLIYILAPPPTHAYPAWAGAGRER